MICLLCALLHSMPTPLHADNTHSSVTSYVYTHPSFSLQHIEHVYMIFSRLVLTSIAFFPTTRLHSLTSPSSPPNPALQDTPSSELDTQHPPFSSTRSSPASANSASPRLQEPFARSGKPGGAMCLHMSSRC
jgi:hypothetical protein